MIAMHQLSVDPARCVRNLSKFSQCSACIDICPTGALSFEGQNIAVRRDLCVGCGGCIGVCPTEAPQLESLSLTRYIFKMAESSDRLVSCKRGIPCIAALSVEQLLSLAMLSEDPLILDVGHCASCPVREPLYARIVRMAEEANYLLEAMQQPGCVRLEAVTVEPEDVPEGENGDDRRAFLERFSLKGAVKSRQDFEVALEEADMSEEERYKKVKKPDVSDIARMRQKVLPDKRKLLFAALKRAEKPQHYHTVEGASVSFVSQKYVDPQACTNCQVCYRICPTGALSATAQGEKILFDATLCLKCALCHDSCEPDAIHLQEGFEIKEFFEPTQRVLASFNVKRCNECGLPFVYRGGEQICPRCALEEEEALKLHGRNREDARW